MANKTKEEEEELAAQKVSDQVDLGALVLKEKKYYEESTRSIRDGWDDLHDLYIGKLPPAKHKSLSRNFIPKAHQAVETLASFLAGNNPSLFVTPVGESDDDKARFMAKLLEFQWVHDLHAKPKVLTWVKSAILFGVGVMKVGWDADTDAPFIYPVNIGDFYTSPYERDLQKTHSVIERLILPIDYVEKKYGVKGLIPLGTSNTNLLDSTVFDVKEIDPVSRTMEQRVELLERHTLQDIITVIVQPAKDKDGNVSQRGMNVRKVQNKKGFIGYVSLHYKDSPLPNRFYTIGAIAPVARTQKRMNATLNQMTDNINLMMNPYAKVRRGSAIDTRELVLFPGRAVYMGDIQRDLEWGVVPDTTNTGYKLLQYLDGEFQRGTTVTDIRQGEGGSNTAAEARIQQANLNVTTSLVKENVEDAIAQLGTFLAKLNIQNINSARSIRIFDPGEVFDFEVLTSQRPPNPLTPAQPLPMSALEQQDIQRVGRVFRFNKGDLDGDYDIRVQADSTLMQNRDVLRKQMQDWLSFLSGLGVQINTEKATKDWGSISGIADAAKYIDKTPKSPPPPKPEDQAKVLQALADLVKSGATVYDNQIQAAMTGQWPLPPGQGEQILNLEQSGAQVAPQTGPGGGEGLAVPSPTETSTGLTGTAQEMQIAQAQPTALTQ